MIFILGSLSTGIFKFLTEECNSSRFVNSKILSIDVNLLCKQLKYLSVFL